MGLFSKFADNQKFGLAWMLAWNEHNGYGRVQDGGLTDNQMATARMMKGAGLRGEGYNLHFERWRKSGESADLYLADNWDAVLADCDQTPRCVYCGTSKNVHVPSCPLAHVA